MSSRVLAIGVNSQYVHSCLPIRYFKAVSGCDIFECSINDNIFDVYSKLLSFDNEIFAFSVYIWNRDFVVNLINMLSTAKPKIKIIAGGPEAGFAPADFFDLCENCDAVAFGEGENTFIALEKGEELTSAPNLIFRNFKTSKVDFFGIIQVFTLTMVKNGIRKFHKLIKVDFFLVCKRMIFADIYAWIYLFDRCKSDILGCKCFVYKFFAFTGDKYYTNGAVVVVNVFYNLIDTGLFYTHFKFRLI